MGCISGCQCEPVMLPHCKNKSNRQSESLVLYSLLCFLCSRNSSACNFVKALTGRGGLLNSGLQPALPSSFGLDAMVAAAAAIASRVYLRQREHRATSPLPRMPKEQKASFATQVCRQWRVGGPTSIVYFSRTRMVSKVLLVYRGTRYFGSQLF